MMRDGQGWLTPHPRYFSLSGTVLKPNSQANCPCWAIHIFQNLGPNLEF